MQVIHEGGQHGPVIEAMWAKVCMSMSVCVLWAKVCMSVYL